MGIPSPTPRNLTLLGWLACAAPFAGTPRGYAADLLVSSQTTNSVLRYDGATGASLGVFASGGGIDDPLDLVIGPDTNLYVSSGRSNTVLRFDGRTGASIGVFASGGGLDGPEGMAFGPDGNLYVCSSNTNSVLRFSGTTGAFMDAFVPAGSGGVWHPRALAFGPDGDLYVLNYNDATVLRFDGRTGAFRGVFVPERSGGLFTPIGMAFGPDGDLYVSGGAFGDNGVRRYDGRTGAFLGLFGRMPGYEVPLDVVFGPDGNLYVSTGGATHGVLRFDGSCGALIDAFVPHMSGGLANPFGIVFTVKPRSEPLPYVERIRIRAKVPDTSSGLPICAGDSIRVIFAGNFPNDCFRLKRIELFDDRLGPAPEPPIVRLVVDDGGCLDRACAQVPVPWEAAVTLPPLPARGYDLLAQLAKVSCTDSILPGNLNSTVVPFCVAPADSCGRGLRCVMGLWDHGGRAGDCDAFVSPGRPAQLTFQVSSAVGLAGVQGEFDVWEPGLRVVGLEPVGPAADMHLSWTPTPAGARFVLFAEHGAPIPAGIEPVSILRLTLAQPIAVPDSLGHGHPVVGLEFHVTTRELLGSDIDGGAIPYCVGAFPHIDFHPDVATICTEGPCDFNGDGSADVRDLVLMVHCVLDQGPCPPDAGTRFDCDGSGSFNLSDVLCCALHVLRGPGCPDCPVDSVRTEPGVRVSLGAPRRIAGGVELPITIEGADRIGAARLTFHYPADRFTAQVAGAGPLYYLYDVEGDELRGGDKLTLGLIGGFPQPLPIEGGSPSIVDPGPMVLRLLLRPGRSVGGEVRLVDGELSGPDGVMLDVDLDIPAVMLPEGATLSLLRVHPNPFSSSATLTVQLDAPSSLELTVHDLSGRRVSRVFRGTRDVGLHYFPWNGRADDGSSLPDGVYFLRAAALGSVVSRKIVLVRGPDRAPELIAPLNPAAP